DVGDEWTYESFIDGTPNNKQGFNITKLNDWPSYPNADYYSNYIYSYNHLIDISLLVDNNSISYFLSIGPTEVRKYGGEPCNCVIVKNYMLADQLIYDIDKGILLESDFNDAGTLRNFTLISWSVLLPGPDITINSPNENDLFNLTPPNYIVAINDPNLNYTWYTLNEGDPIYFLGVNGTNIGTIDPTSWSILDDGSVTIRFSANNSEGIIGYSEITVIKDVSSPVVSIHLPENLDEFGRDPPSYEINITEVNLEYAWYTLNNSDPIFFSGSNGLNSGIINLDIWNEFGNGPILITFYVNDTTGIVIFDFVIIEKYVKPKSNGIPGYDLFLLFGSLTIIICLLLRNFRKKTNF
ncbi:MAG: hypothetical protein JXA99_05655, partial [Candidatus Lokiarchaeota archaeon]|nr:hypothetical protein [Candidatus Lokiarchaeota archaeon]